MFIDCLSFDVYMIFTLCFYVSEMCILYNTFSYHWLYIQFQISAILIRSFTPFIPVDRNLAMPAFDFGILLKLVLIFVFIIILVFEAELGLWV